jgi:hypothetical protein
MGTAKVLLRREFAAQNAHIRKEEKYKISNLNSCFKNLKK